MHQLLRLEFTKKTTTEHANIGDSTCASHLDFWNFLSFMKCTNFSINFLVGHGYYNLLWSPHTTQLELAKSQSVSPECQPRVSSAQSIISPEYQPRVSGQISVVLRRSKAYELHSFKHCSDYQIHVPVRTFILIFKYDIGLKFTFCKVRLLCIFSLL